MLTKLFLLIVSLLFTISSVSQDEDLRSAFLIPSNLSNNAYAIVRWDDTKIEVKSYNDMTITTKRIVTILNSSGNYKHGANVYYDEHTKIKKLEAKIYDAVGKEIKKFRKNDFEDVSAVSGATLYSDTRMKYLQYTPISYPYTVELEIQVDHSSTGFIQGWWPIEGYHTSTQNSDYEIINSSQIPIKIKTSNFESYKIEKEGEFHFSARNLSSIKPELYSPDFSKFAPTLKATLTEFDMEGVKGSNDDWQDFGKWMNDKLIRGTQELPEKVKRDIKVLTANATTDIEKAKIVYNYLQEKTRYISVQIGIGGWKPMLASDVDRLGYGDCKGLSNYTKALLDEVGVNSYYAIIYGDRDIVDIDSTFSSIQGNHAVLCIPTESDYIWLECTSQTTPFGYSANFTDDRDALIITPEGGKIVHTTVYNTEGNLLNTNALVNFSDTGAMSASILSKSYGTQYSYHEGVQKQDLKDQKLHYKENWNYINGLNIDKMEYRNDRDSIVFTETIQVTAEKYASKAGTRLLVQPNVFNRSKSAPPRYDERKIPFEISRGSVHTDSYTISIDNTLEVEALMDNVTIQNKFGEYSVSIKEIGANQLTYNRKLTLNKGSYSIEDYEAFRKFCLEIIKVDNSKIVLISKS